jgi:hypothetical protein
MLRTRSSLVIVMILGALVAGLAGCKKEGPAERAGKGIDQAGEKAGKQLEKAGDNVKDAVKDLKK